MWRKFSKYWYAKGLLGFCLIINILKRLFCLAFQKTGLEKFRENFYAEGIFPIEPDQRMIDLKFSHCIGCNICSLAHPLLPIIATTIVRDLSKVGTVSHLLSISPEVIKRGEELCPFDVPLAAMLARIEQRKKNEDEVRGA